MMIIVFVFVLMATIAGCRADNKTESGIPGCQKEEGFYCSWDAEYEVECNSTQVIEGTTDAGCAFDSDGECSWDDDLDVSCNSTQDTDNTRPAAGFFCTGDICCSWDENFDVDCAYIPTSEDNKTMPDIGCINEDGLYCSWDAEYEFKCNSTEVAEGTTGAGCAFVGDTECSWDDDLDVSCNSTQDNDTVGYICTGDICCSWDENYEMNCTDLPTMETTDPPTSPVTTTERPSIATTGTTMTVTTDNKAMPNIGCINEDGLYCSWDADYEFECNSTEVAEGTTGAGCAVDRDTECSWDDDLDVSCNSTQDNDTVEFICTGDTCCSFDENYEMNCTDIPAMETTDPPTSPVTTTERPNIATTGTTKTVTTSEMTTPSEPPIGQPTGTAMPMTTPQTPIGTEPPTAPAVITTERSATTRTTTTATSSEMRTPQEPPTGDPTEREIPMTTPQTPIATEPLTSPVTTTERPTTATTETTTTVTTRKSKPPRVIGVIFVVRLRFNGRFDLQMDTSMKRRTFIDMLLNWLFFTMVIAENRFIHMNTYAGSIVATFTVLPDPQGNATTESAIEKLEKEVNKGDVTLVGSDGTTFTLMTEENGGFQYTETGSCTIETCQEIDNRCRDEFKYMCTCNVKYGDFCDQDNETSSPVRRKNMVLAIVGSILLLILIVVIVVCIICWKRSKMAEHRFNQTEGSFMSTLAHEEGFKSATYWKPQRSDVLKYQYREPGFNRY